MKFINCIQKGDFVRLMSLDEVREHYGGELDFCPILGGKSFKFKPPRKDADDEEENNNFFLSPNVLHFLGQVVRIEHSGSLKYSHDNHRVVKEHLECISLTASSNGLSFYYEDGETVDFPAFIVAQVFIGGKWYNAHATTSSLC